MDGRRKGGGGAWSTSGVVTGESWGKGQGIKPPGADPVGWRVMGVRTLPLILGGHPNFIKSVKTLHMHVNVPHYST